MDRLMNVSFAQYLWALIAVRTRTFKVEKARADPEASSGSARSFDAMLDSGSTSCMVPYVDMMNHDFNYSARYVVLSLLCCCRGGGGPLCWWCDDDVVCRL